MKDSFQSIFSSSERRIRPFWHYNPVESHRLTESDITEFVNCVKDYVFMAIFNKNYDEEAAEAFQYLSILRPELIIPTIIEKSVPFPCLILSPSFP